MQSLRQYTESNKVNKFDINWQIVRTKARSIKDVGEKLEYVLSFLRKSPTFNNYGRVLNWVKMTGVAYPKGSEQRQSFVDAQNDLEENREIYSDMTDDGNDFSNIELSDLKLVLNDLKKRKYGFQYKTVPKAHTEFVKALEDAISERTS